MSTPRDDAPQDDVSVAVLEESAQLIAAHTEGTESWMTRPPTR
jgi:hypothetical protein